MIAEKVSRGALAVCLLMVLLPMSDSARAEPTDTVRGLMDSPVSMLDWGIYNLQEQVNRCIETFTGDDWSADVRYEWDTNRIVIRVMDLIREPTDEANAMWWCTLLLEETRSCLGVDRTTGKPISGDRTFVEGFFKHSGYVLEGRQIDLGLQLDKIVEIEATSRKDSSKSVFLRYRGSLLGTEKFFAEVPFEELFN